MIECKEINYIAFDLDGTLVDSVPDLAQALRMMMADLGNKPVSDDDVRNWIGNGAEIMVKRALSNNVIINPELNESQALIALERFEYHYENNGHGKTLVYEGVEKTLSRLKSAGFIMGIVTNKPHQFVPEILKDLNLHHYFSDIIGGGTLATNKPSPEGLEYLRNKYQLSHKNMLMVGDSKNDILAAKNAGIASIGLSYGYNYGEPISDSNPDMVLDNFSQLLTALEVKG